MPKRYQKIGNATIRPFVLKQGQSACELAQRYYAKHSKKSFLSVLTDYLENGYVESMPNLFAMVKVIPHPDENDKRRGWWIEFAIGNIGYLLSRLPCPLEFVAFCRDDDNNMRIVEWEHFLKMVKRHGVRNQYVAKTV